MDPKRARALAQQAVQRARRRGHLLRPDACENCGVSGVPHAHHDDYSKPLDVRWLCRLCHAAEHTESGWTSEARLLRDQGATYAEIGRVFGVTEAAVYKRLNPDRARVYAQRDNAGGRRNATKRAHEKQRVRSLEYRGRCLNCNGPMGIGVAYDGKCRSCWTEPERAAAIATLWAEGLTSAQIAERLGYEKFSLRVQISKLRAKGYDIPHRRTPEQVKRISEASARGLGRSTG